MFVLLGALGSSVAIKDPIAALAPGVVYDAVVAVIVGPLAVAIHDRYGGRGARRLVSTSYLDRRHEYSRPLSRFLIFGLAVIIGLSALTARLFYLQVMNGAQFSTLANGNRTVVQAIPSSRGLIYDRSGRPSSSTSRPSR